MNSTEEFQSNTEGSRFTWFSAVWISFVALLCLSVGEGVYSFRLNHRLTEVEGSLQSTLNSQGETIQKLSQNINETKQIAGDMQGEITYTKQRLGTTQVELRKAQQSSAQLAQQHKEAVQQWNSQLGQVQQEQATTQGTVGNLSSDVAGVKDGLNSTKEQLDTTRSDLQRVVGDLGVQSDLIATNRGEIAELRLRGERDYYEFDLAKTKRPQRVGNLAIDLKKADVKRQRYTINLTADDHSIEKKDKTVNEPVQFYQAGFRQPSEIVVNQIYKDRIVGYVSVPKKKESRTAQTQSGPSDNSKPRS